MNDLPLIELKALAYDKLAQIQYLQGELGQLNQLIAQKSQEVKTEDAEEAV